MFGVVIVEVFPGLIVGALIVKCEGLAQIYLRARPDCILATRQSSASAYCEPLLSIGARGQIRY